MDFIPSIPKGPKRTPDILTGESPDKTANVQASEPRGRKNQRLGRKGEEAAVKFLTRRGYDILERNWKCFAGEVDIIAKDGDCIVFLEVKTRTGYEKGFPSEAVNGPKRERYEKMALAYLAAYETADIPVRFDVIAIVVVAPDRAVIRHHINAFSSL